MLRMLIVLAIGGITGLKLFSFRHSAPDGAATLWLGAWSPGRNDRTGPLPEGDLVLLAEGQGGFPFEDLYLVLMELAWALVAAAIVAIVLIQFLKPKY